MTMYRRLLLAAYRVESNNCLVPFDQQGDLMKKKCADHVDTLLNELGDPDVDMVEAGQSGEAAKNFRMFPINIFGAMIRAIKP